MQFRILLIGFAFVWTSFAQAKGPKTVDKGFYIVPTSPELVSYSRFDIKIVEAFKGPSTQKISYVFPEILVGAKDQLVEFTRIPQTENSWISDSMRAECTVNDDMFSCNIYLIEPDEPSPQARPNASPKALWIDWIIPKAFANLNSQTHTPLDLNRSLAHLQSLNLTPEELLSYQVIVNDFFSGEPAGILFYEFQ